MNLLRDVGVMRTTDLLIVSDEQVKQRDAMSASLNQILSIAEEGTRRRLNEEEYRTIADDLLNHHKSYEKLSDELKEHKLMIQKTPGTFFEHEEEGEVAFHKARAFFSDFWKSVWIAVNPWEANLGIITEIISSMNQIPNENTPIYSAHSKFIEKTYIKQLETVRYGTWKHDSYQVKLRKAGKSQLELTYSSSDGRETFVKTNLHHYEPRICMRVPMSKDIVHMFPELDELPSSISRESLSVFMSFSWFGPTGGDVVTLTMDISNLAKISYWSQNRRACVFGDTKSLQYWRFSDKSYLVKKTENDELWNYSMTYDDEKGVWEHCRVPSCFVRDENQRPLVKLKLNVHRVHRPGRTDDVLKRKDVQIDDSSDNFPKRSRRVQKRKGTKLR